VSDGFVGAEVVPGEEAEPGWVSVAQVDGDREALADLILERWAGADVPDPSPCNRRYQRLRFSRMGCRLVGLPALLGSLVVVTQANAAQPRRVTLRVGFKRENGP